jgi:hypothetical protein
MISLSITSLGPSKDTNKMEGEIEKQGILVCFQPLACELDVARVLPDNCNANNYRCF